MLPPGENPWEVLKANIERHYPQGSTNRWLYTDRVDFLNQFKPNFIAEGINGFDGYFILGYEDKGMYVAENIQYGNATCFFDSHWKELSKFSKAEIIKGDLAVERIIHGKTRKRKIKILLTPQQNTSLLKKVGKHIPK